MCTSILTRSELNTLHSIVSEQVINLGREIARYKHKNSILPNPVPTQLQEEFTKASKLQLKLSYMLGFQIAA